jgi:predicted DsbA family dithiol-disulfide isomerase
MNPIVDGVKNAYKGRVSFVYVEMSSAAGKREAKEEGVMGTPTFLLLDENGERVYVLQGVYPRETLEQHLDNLLAQK